MTKEEIQRLSDEELENIIQKEEAALRYMMMFRTDEQKESEEFKKQMDYFLDYLQPFYEERKRRRK